MKNGVENYLAKQSENKEQSAPDDADFLHDWDEFSDVCSPIIVPFVLFWRFTNGNSREKRDVENGKTKI